MRIDIVTKADEELYEAFQRLVPQLTNNNPPPSLNDLADLVRDSSSTLMVARNEKQEIVGALTLAVYRVPTGIRSIIEDVIVDTSARGQGIGEALMQRAIEIAKEKGAGNISLTSNPLRESANRLYLRVGFKKRETNAYQMKF
ncbi:MAG TPA: GNAT family N-acetyltransferase [Anaerolineales bacterium]|nr:GNAT family N-acetyltransferase [Anaerolineales bacterium]HMV98090.1 GNAT family N-acetyltransferase [Anaerolineales bacterium]HMX21201.1 GNAT family N-acetyltransferase [Anaerolineales bacterium]HMX76244.1 GNAT family N-acetyltransferase [Anaerolineales bacterium]HMZ45000.1 GNAT family N-acetyltransferase [Anaerolineales bacterium]